LSAKTGHSLLAILWPTSAKMLQIVTFFLINKTEAELYLYLGTQSVIKS
jgi:hypothetical protein